MSLCAIRNPLGETFFFNRVDESGVKCSTEPPIPCAAQQILKPVSGSDPKVAQSRFEFGLPAPPEGTKMVLGVDQKVLTWDGHLGQTTEQMICPAKWEASCP